jgi:hypothetical protein
VHSFDHLQPKLELAAPPHPDDLYWLRQDVGSLLPADCLAFIEEHDGATGDAGCGPPPRLGRGRDVCPGPARLVGDDADPQLAQEELE